MFEIMRAFRPSGAKRSRLTDAVRWTAAALLAVAVSVPGTLLAGPACEMAADGSGCARCEAKASAKPATETPSCHAPADVAPQTTSCHETGTAGDCCALQSHDVPAALFGGEESIAPGDGPTLAGAVDVPHLFPLCIPARVHAPASDSPPGSSGLLVAQNTILRL